MSIEATELLVDLYWDLERAGIESLEVDGNRLGVQPRSAITPDLRRRLKTHKDELVAALNPREACEPRNPGVAFPRDSQMDPGDLPGDPDPWDTCEEPPAPCSQCGGLMFWWNPLGDVQRRLGRFAR